MSRTLTEVPLEIVSSIPEALDLSDNIAYSVFNGAKQFTCRTYEATSYSDSNLTISCNPTSNRDVILPVMYKEIDLEVTATVTNANTGGTSSRFGFTVETSAENAAKAGHYLAPRSMPLDKIISNEYITLNGQQFNTSLSDYEEAFVRFCNTFEDRAGFYSLTPYMLDEMGSYTESNLTFRDPFAAYGDSFIRESRSAFSGNNYRTSDATEVLGSGGSQTMQFFIKACEPVKVSPFFYQSKGITDIGEMQYGCNFGTLARAIAYKGSITGITLSNVSVSVSGARIKMYFMTPKLLQRIPRGLAYSYNDINSQRTPCSNKSLIGANGYPADDVFTQITNNINLKAIPRRLIIWVGERKSAKQGTTETILSKTDTLKAQIKKLRINFGNTTGILGNASQQDLYSISKKNGVNMTFPQWSKYIGSVIALDFGSDIGLDTDLSVGCMANPLLSIEVDWQPLVTVAGIEYDLNFALVYDGVISIVNGAVNSTVSVIDRVKVLESQQEGVPELIEPAYCENMYGGKKLMGGSPLAAVLSALPLIRKGVQIGAPIVKGIADVAEKIGFGAEAGIISGKIAGKKKGGKVLSKQEFMANMY